MSARSGEWQLLGHDHDPVPGDVEQVERLAGGYRSTADEIERLTGQLRRMSDLDGWTGEAAETFAESAGDLAEDLGGAHRRYSELAAAVREWVAPLSRALDESAGALRDAEAAEEDRRRHASDPYADLVDPTPDQLAAQRQWSAAQDDAAQRLQRARKRLGDALDELDSAAERIADRIRAAAEHGDDGFWDDLGGAVRAADWLETIATWAGRIALALAVITVAMVFLLAAPAGALAAALLWGALAAGGVQLGLHGVLLAAGDESVTWVQIGMDVLGLVTAGTGAWITKGLSRAVPLLRGQVAHSADDAARGAQEVLETGAANYTRAGNATHIPDPANNLRRWGHQYLDDAAERTARAGQQAADDVHAGAITQAPRADRVRALDADLAADLSELQRLGRVQDLSDPLRGQLDDLLRQGGLAVSAKQVNLVAQLADSTDDLVVDWKDPTANWASDRFWQLTR